MIQRKVDPQRATELPPNYWLASRSYGVALYREVAVPAGDGIQVFHTDNKIGGYQTANEARAAAWEDFDTNAE